MALRNACLIALAQLRSCAPLVLTWENEIGAAGHICSSITGKCHSFTHVVFTATPVDVTHSLTGGAQFSLDGGLTYQDGGDVVFEHHLVTGTCKEANCTRLGNSQMFNWGYQAAATLTDADRLPDRICLRPWMIDLDVELTSSVTLQPKCVDFGPLTTVNHLNTNGTLLTKYNALSSAATRHCSSSVPARCRANVHVVFTAAITLPTELPHAGGELSFDGGVTWSSAGSVAFYEQHINKDPKTGILWHALQFDFDELWDAESSESPHGQESQQGMFPRVGFGPINNDNRVAH